MATTSPSAGFIDVCPRCGTSVHGFGNFCTTCGAGIARAHDQTQAAGLSPHRVAARGFGQAFGLHPILALTAIVTDCMVSAVDFATIGVSAPVLWLIAGIFMGIIVFMGQKKWAGDDPESAFIKALIVSFLVALPTPFPSFLTIPSGIVGMVQVMRRKKTE